MSWQKTVLVDLDIICVPPRPSSTPGYRMVGSLWFKARRFEILQTTLITFNAQLKCLSNNYNYTIEIEQKTCVPCLVEMLLLAAVDQPFIS